METGAGTSPKASTLRWKILRQALLRKPSGAILNLNLFLFDQLELEIDV